jgi:signal peptidase I
MDEIAFSAPTLEVGSLTDRPRERVSHRAPKGAAKPERTGRKRKSGKRNGRHRRIMPDRPFWQELPILIIVAFVAAYLVKTFLLQVFFIPSISMENTLLVKDRVLVDKLTGNFRDIKRGEVIVFNAEGVLAPEGASAAPPASTNLVSRTASTLAGALGLAQSNETDYIKRVIGLPGDRVACCDDQGRMTVNGVPLDETAYLFPGDQPSASNFDVVVPEGKLWVMGDHRSQSADSRSRIGAPGGGFVPIDRVVGRAFVRTWPVSRVGSLPIPDTLKQPAIEQNRGTAS